MASSDFVQNEINIAVRDALQSGFPDTTIIYRKESVRFSKDALPVILIDGNTQTFRENVFNLKQIYDFIVNVIVILPGNRNLSLSNPQLFAMSEQIRKIMLGLNFTALGVYSSTTETDTTYDKSAIDTNYDANPMRFIYSAVVDRQ